MQTNLDKHNRRSIRLKDYDYSRAGAYFITICCYNKTTYFENVKIRNITEQCWMEIPQHFPNVYLDEYVIMPNHLHGILILQDSCRGVQLNAPTQNSFNKPFSKSSPRQNTISLIIRTFKAAVTTQSRHIGHEKFAWQRNYYDHIIRKENELESIRQYINENPLKWELDEENPNKINRRAGSRLCL